MATVIVTFQTFDEEGNEIEKIMHKDKLEKNEYLECEVIDGEPIIHPKKVRL